jgi:hypothetical protein
VLSLPANIGPGGKGMAVTNTQAYFGIATILATNGFMVQAPAVLITTHHFLHNIQMGPIGQCACHWQAFSI